MNPELQTNNTTIEEQEIDLRELFLKIYKRRWLILSIALISVTLTLIYSFMTIPVYQAISRIMIETQTSRILRFEDVEVPDYHDTTNYFNSQVEILKSNIVAGLVYEEMGGYEPSAIQKKKLKYKDDKALTKEDRVKLLLSSVDIKIVPRSNLIDIKVENIDPALAAKIANVWMYAYISYPLVSEAYLMQRVSGSLEKAAGNAREKLKKAEEELNEYRRTHNIIDTYSGGTESTAIMSELIKRKAELEAELVQQLNYYKDKHPVIMGLRSELKSIEDKIAKESKLQEKEVQYEILRREVETSRAFYESLANRLNHTEAVGGLKAFNIKIVDEAKVPTYPVRPNKKLNLLISLFGSLFGGTVLAFFLEGLDQSIKTPEEIEKILGLPFLVLIPRYKSEDKLISTELFASKDRHAPATEAYRSLRTNIIFSNPDLQRKTLLVTSTAPEEGKTTIATNLAIVFAQAGEKTILVDADFRHPKLHNIFGVSRENGITEVLARDKDNSDFSSYIHHTDIPNLDLLTCGAIPPNPSEILGSQSMEDFIQKLYKTYDRIIFDSPPILAVTDAVILASKTDLVVFIVKSEHTYRRAAIRAKELLNSVEAKILGIVLNMVETEKHGGYNYYYYYHYHYGYPIRKKKSSDKSSPAPDQSAVA